jgi:hypothetical protein
MNRQPHIYLELPMKKSWRPLAGMLNLSIDLNRYNLPYDGPPIPEWPVV